LSLTMRPEEDLGLEVIKVGWSGATRKTPFTGELRQKRQSGQSNAMQPSRPDGQRTGSLSLTST
jgi:hypothetical protein